MIPFYIINNVSISVNTSNFNFVFLKASYHVNNPGAKRKWAESSLYI